jgi:hypothetical protein
MLNAKAGRTNKKKGILDLRKDVIVGISLSVERSSSKLVVEEGTSYLKLLFPTPLQSSIRMQCCETFFSNIIAPWCSLDLDNFLLSKAGNRWGVSTSFQNISLQTDEMERKRQKRSPAKKTFNF